MEKNLAHTIIAAIAEKRDTLPDFSSEYEAYALIKKSAEAAESASTMKKCVEHFWTAVKEGNEEAAQAYASQLATDARTASVAFAELAACAAKAAEY